MGSVCLFVCFDLAFLGGVLGFSAPQDDERLQGGDGERRDAGILRRIQGADRKYEPSRAKSAFPSPCFLVW